MKGMNKVLVRTLISQAQMQMKNATPKLVRAEVGFIPIQSLSLAICDLKESQRLLELAKFNLQQDHQMNTLNHPLPLLHNEEVHKELHLS